MPHQTPHMICDIALCPVMYGHGADKKVQNSRDLETRSTFREEHSRLKPKW